MGHRHGVGIGDGDDVVRAHARREQRLVRVAHRRVGDEHARLFAHPAREGGRPVAVEALLGSVRRAAREHRRDGFQCGRIGFLPAARFGMAVHRDVGDVVQELCGAVLAADRRDQLRRLVDEAGRVAGVAKFRMADDVLEEGEVGRDTADAEFPQRPVHARDRFLRRGRPSRDLLEQRVVEPRDDRAGISGAAVEADAEAGGAAIGGDAAVVGDEILLGILRGNAALEGVPVQPDIRLRRDAGLRIADALAFDQADLRLDDVDAGDLLGHRVLDLDTRIDLDEVEFSGCGVLQELDRAGTDIVRGRRDLQRVTAQALALGLRQVRGGRALDHLLVTPLDRAVPLEEVDAIAVRVAQHLHLDMPCLLDQLLEIDLVLAEGSLRLALCLRHIAQQRIGIADHAHAAPAAAPRRLQHHRVADLLGERFPAIGIVGERIGRGHDRHAGGDGKIARRHLIAELSHRFG